MTGPKLFKFRSLGDPIKLNYGLDCAKGLLPNNSYRCKTSSGYDVSKICGARSRPTGITVAGWALMGKFAYGHTYMPMVHPGTRIGIGIGGAHTYPNSY